jgi:ArsR family transcriptional regulator, virulence genes transcriptional regulator
MKNRGSRIKPPSGGRTTSRAAAATAQRISADEMLEHAGEAAVFLKALANEQRLHILCSLLEKPLAVGELNGKVKLSQSALSQHLGVLRESGLVDAERQGQTIRYSIPEGDVRRVLSVLHEIFCGNRARRVTRQRIRG